MWPSQWLSIKDEQPELLAQCRGLTGQPWSYLVSHRQMLVRFYEPGSLAGIYLYCKSCHSVQFESAWLDSHLGVEISPGPYGSIYTITDSDRLRIVCGAAFWAESADLIHLHDQLF